VGRRLSYSDDIAIKNGEYLDVHSIPLRQSLFDAGQRVVRVSVEEVEVADSFYAASPNSN
jgi:hypothetical protein